MVEQILWTTGGGISYARDFPSVDMAAPVSASAAPSVASSHADMESIIEGVIRGSNEIFMMY